MAGREIKQINPATGEVIASIPMTSPEAAVQMFRDARAAQHDSWAPLTFKQRAAFVQRMKRFLADNAQRVARTISQCTGKTIQDALATEVLPCIMACDWYSSNTASVLKRQRLGIGNLLFANKSNHLEYLPLGVVGIISPWNYPFSIPFGEIIMGLMAGNGIILKVAQQTVLVGELIAEVVGAGRLPAGLFAHLIVGGAQASELMFSNRVDKIFFTGSVPVGKQLMRDASATLTPLSLELGGNDAMVVLDDADLHRSVNCAAWAGFQNAGQSCGGIQRIYVHEKLFDAFVDLLAAKTRALRHGPDDGVSFQVDMGALTTAKQLETVTAMVADAVEQGARIVAQSRPVGDVTKGFFYPATVLVNTTPRMRMVTEECFGPVVTVMPFSNDAEGARLANDCNLALTASVFSTNGKRAKAFASTLEAGVVTINDHLYSHGQSEAPWGGWKESGLGRTHGSLGLKEMSHVRCINSDLLPSGAFPSNMWWYPFSEKTYRGVLTAVTFLAPRSIWDTIKAGASLVPFAVGKMRDRWVPKPAA